MTTCSTSPTNSLASSAPPALTFSRITRSLALPSVKSPDGWVVFSTTTIPGVGRVVTEKRDGETRSRSIGR